MREVSVSDVADRLNSILSNGFTEPVVVKKYTTPVAILAPYKEDPAEALSYEKHPMGKVKTVLELIQLAEALAKESRACGDTNGAEALGYFCDEARDHFLK